MAEVTKIQWHEHAVQRVRGCVVWFTGLSGSGKSTVANAVDALLDGLGAASFVLDGDNVRHGLNASPALLEARHGKPFAERFGLGFSAQDREENIRRIGCVAELFCSAGIIALTAFVSPYRRDRQLVREIVTARGQATDFVEVFVDTPLEICERRDPKGLYQQARAGLLRGMTGIDDPYEPPEQPELTLGGGVDPPDVLAQLVIEHLRRIGKLPGEETL
ncbi:MAG TPA: adenylyl-sulfate kinase [Pirellulaceae bacterium]|nr:adenylyl-sulfate kinase [Pirellulaceae bacterium]